MYDLTELKKLFPHRFKTPSYPSSVFVAEGARLLGDIEIGRDSSIWFNTIMRADVSYIRIGERTNIQDCSLIHESFPSTPCIIGNSVTVGHSVILHACFIGDFSLIGMGSIVLDDAEIGDHVLLGAGSLVTQGTKIPPGVLAFGRPAKVVRPLTLEERKKLEVSAEHYVKLSKSYLATG